MKRICALSGIALIGLSLSGCFDGGSSGGGSSAPDSRVSFTQFVQDEINNTRDDRDPASINDIEFRFNDQTNEQAFDNVLK